MIHIGKNYPNFEYGLTIKESVEYEKDLGIPIKDNLKIDRCQFIELTSSTMQDND